MVLEGVLNRSNSAHIEEMGRPKFGVKREGVVEKYIAKGIKYKKWKDKKTEML